MIDGCCTSDARELRRSRATTWIAVILLIAGLSLLFGGLHLIVHWHNYGGVALVILGFAALAPASRYARLDIQGYVYDNDLGSERMH